MNEEMGYDTGTGCGGGGKPGGGKEGRGGAAGKRTNVQAYVLCIHKNSMHLNNNVNNNNTVSSIYIYI